MDADFMDTSYEFESSQGGVVRWVASQSTNPALRALMKEAERDKRTRPSTPVHEPMSWTYPLASTSVSTPVSSAWHSSGYNSADTSSLPLSSSSSSASSPSLAPSLSRRTKPLSAAQRKPLASSTSSANQPPRHTIRPRSSSHSTSSDPSASKDEYTPRDDEPEALLFIQLLKETSRQVDENSKKKQQVAREREKEREHSLGRSAISNRTGLDTSNLSARPLTKSTSAFAVCSVSSSTRAMTPNTSLSAHKSESRGRTFARTESLNSIVIDPVSRKSTPTSLPSPDLNRDLELAPVPRLSAGVSYNSNANHATARKVSLPASNDDDSAMQDTIDLTDTDTEWEKPISGPISRADTAMCMELDDEASDTGMDVSFYKPEPPPRTCSAAPRPKPQIPQLTRPPAPTQRNRTGPPPLGMRRAPQLQSSQHGSTQSSKGATVPRFKPPLLANARGTTDKIGSGSKPATTTGSKVPPRCGATNMAAARGAVRPKEDPDSSFDVSFDVDADALEEAMKAYD